MKRHLPFVSFVVLAIVLGLATGCSKKPDDAQISGDIQSKYSQDSGLANKQLKVDAENGVVTLSGTVDNDAQREAASRQASSIPGVKQVVNNLKVEEASAPAPSSTPAPEPAAPKPIAMKSSQDKKPQSGKKSHKSHVAHDADMDGDSGMGSGSNPSMASNQSAPDPAPANISTTSSTPVPPPPPAPKKMILDQGTQLAVRLIDSIDSEKNQTGDTFRATLNNPLTSDGEEAVPAGVEVTGHLVSVKSAGKFAGQSEVVLQLDSIQSGGRSYNLQTDTYQKKGSSRGKNTAEKVGGGAAIGAIIGAIAGGGKGAGIGAAAGAGVGGGVQAVTKGQQIKLPSETVLSFTLQAPITVVQAPKPDSNRQKLGDSQQP